MFLILASSCLARLHHSLLITRFLLPSTPPGRRAWRSRGMQTSVRPPQHPPPPNSGLGVPWVLGRPAGTQPIAEASAWAPRGDEGSAHREAETSIPQTCPHLPHSRFSGNSAVRAEFGLGGFSQLAPPFGTSQEA